MADPVQTTETYKTLPSGLQLRWFSQLLPDSPPVPAVLVLHPGGYKTGSPSNIPAIAVAQAGFWGLAVEYRLAPPHTEMNTPNHPSPGQNTVGDDGHFPEQTDDVRAAIRAARADARCNGKVYVMGGSAGASHAMYLAATGTVGDDCPDAVVLCSCGVSNLDDANIMNFPLTDGQTDANFAILNYIPGVDPADLASRNWTPYHTTLQSASPTAQLTTVKCPVYILQSDHDSEAIPSSTGTYMGVTIPSYDRNGVQNDVTENGANGLIPRLLTVGYTESTADTPEVGKFKYTLVQTQPNRRGINHYHAFEYFDLDDSVPANVGVSKIIPWLKGSDIIEPPPPPSGNIPKGVFYFGNQEEPVDQSILAREDVDGISTGRSWLTLEPTEGNYDFSFIVSEVQRISAAGKKALIRVPSMGGSETFGGNTPDWVFDAIGSDPGIWDATNHKWTLFPGNMQVFADATTTNGSPTVTSYKAFFTSKDVGRSIKGNGIPNNTYIGVINTPGGAGALGSIGLSSSPTANTPVNATASASNVTITVGDDETLAAGHRPRVAGNRQDLLWGRTYRFQDLQHSGQQTVIPVFWDPVFLAKKRRMYNELGAYLMQGNTLTATEKAAVAIVAGSFANARTEDWNVPHKVNEVDPGDLLDQVAMWQADFDNPVEVNRGSSYTSTKMIEAATKRANYSITDGTTASGSNVFGSLTASFTLADVGKTITGPPGGPIPVGTTISAWTNRTQVELSANATASTTNLHATITNRDTGLFDVLVAAVSPAAITNAAGGNGSLDDIFTNDPNPEFYVARTVNETMRTNNPGLVVVQLNSISNKMPAAPPPNSSNMSFLYEMQQAGQPIAGQALWWTYNDRNYKMNGGVADDYDVILQGAGTRFATYQPYYFEVYSQDFIGLPVSTLFVHNLLNPDAIEPPPPPPNPTVSVPIPSITITPANYRDDVRNQIADLLNVAVDSIAPARDAKWARLTNRHVRYAWRLWRWPELELTEERAFAPIWNATEQWLDGELVYYVGAFDIDGILANTGYYRVSGVPPIGTIPTDTEFFTPYTLVSSDYFIPNLQECRRRLGDIFEVGPNDPKQGVLDYAAYGLDWRVSARGLESNGATSGQTVFIRYRVMPYQYTNTPWRIGTSYKAGDLALLDDDGEVYRAIVPNAGVKPTGSALWAHVPFPIYLANYVVYMTAADDCNDMQTAAQFRATGMEYLAQEMDNNFVQQNQPVYNFGRQQTGYPPLGTSGFLWSVAPPYVAPGEVSTNLITISDTCLNEWGDVIPVQT